MKKSQVTLFVIIAIVAVTAIGVILYGRAIVEKVREAGMPEQAKLAKRAIDDCVESSSKISLGIVSLQGGYIDPENYIQNGILKVGCWYDNGDTSPSIENIENELAELTCLAAEDCINLEEQGIEAEYEKCEANVDVTDDYIKFDVNYPIVINAADESYEFKEYSTDIDVKLTKVYDVAQMIAAEHGNKPDAVCMTCMADIGAENDVFIDAAATKEGLIVTITDEESTIGNSTYKFSFALKTSA